MPAPSASPWLVALVALAVAAGAPSGADMDAPLLGREINLRCASLPPFGGPICVAMSGRGRFYASRTGPTINGRPTVYYFYEPGWGSNILNLHVALLQQRGTEVRVLWTHLVEEGASPPSTFVGDDQTDLRHFWTVSADGSRIYVTGKQTSRRILGQGLGKLRVKTLPPETWCYSRAKNEFLRCR